MRRTLPESIASRLSMCSVTLRKEGLARQASIAAEAGCTGFGIFHPLLPEGTAPSEVKAILDDHGLKATICVPGPFTVLPTSIFSPVEGRRIRRGSQPPDSVDEMVRSLRWLAELQPACVVVIPGAQGPLASGEAWDLAVQSIAKVARVAGDLGITLGIEPVHPRFSTDFSILSDIDAALRFIDDVQAPNVGVLIETFHVWECADLAGQIERAKGRIAGVQLSDSARFARSIVDRLPPGEGVINIAGIIRLIEATDYRGWYDLEVVSDDGSIGYGAYPDSLSTRPAKEVAQRCVDGAVRMLSAASVGR